MPLHMLPEDLLIEIISLLDVASTLTLSETNSTLRNVAVSRPVWHALTQKLVGAGMLRFDRRQAVHLASASAKQLLDCVQALLCGPAVGDGGAIWKAVTALGIGPGLQAHMPPNGLLVLTPEVPDAPKFPYWSSVTLLGGGGTHVFFMGRHTVFCWSVDDDELVWSHAPSTPADRARSFAVRVVEGGRKAVVVFCFYDAKSVLLADIVALDLKTGAADTVLTVQLPESRAYVGISIAQGRPLVCFSISRGFSHVFANWQTRESCIIHANPATNLSITLLDDTDHAVFVETSVSFNPACALARVGAISLSVLEPHWTSSLDCRSSVSSTRHYFFELLLASCALIAMPFIPRPTAAPMNYLWVLRSPIAEHTYRIWACIPWASNPAEPTYEMYAFRLSLTNPASPTLVPRQPLAPTPSPQLMHHGLLPPVALYYSGHRLVYAPSSGRRRASQCCVLPPAETAPAGTSSLTRVQPVLQLPQIESVVDAAPYANGVLYATSNALHICYFA
ncbi:F-box domain-containing protein [Mycena indigotica]|uniref:F-box domain-containing protein n=1 Tax=Mycena indigotica TaxID=2126181 RepID=A0A8H6VS82_9AGAR|nr:F-box domain-containing protein [Mycena indigotica]KAF7292082.1 F-box domain-containing protein [Mycena indigotica]